MDFQKGMPAMSTCSHRESGGTMAVRVSISSQDGNAIGLQSMIVDQLINYSFPRMLTTRDSEGTPLLFTRVSK
jgi:hypothetical protein